MVFQKKFIFKIRLGHSYDIIMVKVFYNIYTSTWAFKLVHGLLTNVAISSDCGMISKHRISKDAEGSRHGLI